MLTVLFSFLRVLLIFFFFFFIFFFFLIVSARIVGGVPTLWTSCMDYKIFFWHVFELKYVFVYWESMFCFIVAACWHWILKPMQIATNVRDGIMNSHNLAKMLFSSLYIRNESYMFNDLLLTLYDGHEGFSLTHPTFQMLTHCFQHSTSVLKKSALPHQGCFLLQDEI